MEKPRIRPREEVETEKRRHILFTGKRRLAGLVPRGLLPIFLAQVQVTTGVLSEQTCEENQNSLFRVHCDLALLTWANSPQSAWVVRDVDK